MRPLIIIAFFSLFFSCKNSQKEIQKTKPKPLLSVVQDHSQFSMVSASYANEIESWKEYNHLKEFISKFANITPNEALSNALELRDIGESLRDSIKPKVLENPAFNSRINVFFNETLRLADMTYISAITADEVNQQVAKTLDAYSAINSKINTVFSQKKFEDAILIEDTFIGIDTTKIDSISLRSIQENNKNQLSKRNPQLKRKKKTITKSSTVPKRLKKKLKKN